MPDRQELQRSHTQAQWRRVRTALRRPSRRDLVVAVVLAVFGFGLVTQVRSTAVHDAYAGYQEQDLVDVLTALSGTAERAEADIERLERAREDLLSDSRSREAALERAREEATDLAVLAGTVPVTGPGLRITISEEDGRVQADDLVDTVQELRTAFAEAIEINDTVRVVAQTSFEDAVGGIVVDGRLLMPPYVLEVIGEPATLRGGLTFTEGPLDLLERSGASVEIEVVERLDIRSLREPHGAGVAGDGSGQ